MTITQEILEIFEDFLEARGVSIPNEDKRLDGVENDPDTAIIYGCDYGELEGRVEEALQDWMEHDVQSTIRNFLKKAVTEE